MWCLGGWDCCPGIVELLNVVGGENDPNLEGDAVMHEYGTKQGGKGKKESWQYQQHPMYVKGNDKEWRYPIEVGKKVGIAYKPILVKVWAESIVMWNDRRDMLTVKGMLKKSVVLGYD